MEELKKVMIIDNDLDVLDIMQEALVYEGFTVTAYEHTNNILSIVEQEKPDVILIDYLLEGINGGEICHQMKVNPTTSDLPVIIISAYPKVILSLGTYGCDKFIAKPFDLDELVSSIKDLLVPFRN
ncbi:response regulator [Mucilaginibacter sp. RCC_168]|uniref:response regulator n=1 Tax=unclassified Mucilaginibacter TaxID=2617802 RepID=UPI003524411F